MKKVFVVAGAAGALALIPAAAGFAGNTALTRQVEMRVTPSASPSADDHGGRPRHAEPGEPAAKPSAPGAVRRAEPGDDHGGTVRHPEPGDDHGGASASGRAPSSGKGSTSGKSGSGSSGKRSAGNGGDDRGGKSGSGKSSGNGRGDDGPGHH